MVHGRVCPQVWLSWEGMPSHVKRRKRSGEDQGSAAVEFVLVLPVLLILLFAIIDFGRMLNAKMVLSQAAHEGARAAAIVDADEATSIINRIVGGMAGSMDDPAIGECDPVGSPDTDATVTLTYHFSYVTPLAVMGGFGDEDGITLTATAVVPCM